MTYQVKVWPEMREEDFNKDLPAAEELGSCDIFLVSRERLAREMQRGKPRGRDAIRGDRRVKSELLKMRFLRLIVDEGHRLGANSKTDDRELLSLISAEVCSYQVRSCDAVALSYICTRLNPALHTSITAPLDPDRHAHAHHRG